MQADPAANDDLKRFDIPRVPAIIFGDRAVHGWNPKGYAELLGVDYNPDVKLAPPVLATRLDRILGSAEALLRAMPDAHIEWTPPERKRPIADLGFHVFRLSLGFVEGMDTLEYPASVHAELAPAELRSGDGLARYGALVRARISGWFQGAGADEWTRTVEAYWGPIGAHDFLERTTWHAAQHLRQLYVLAERLGVKAPSPEPVDAYKDLPLPKALW